jgi:hypothetical protein
MDIVINTGWIYLHQTVYVIGAVRSNSSAMPTVFKEKKRWMRENCKSRRFQMAQRRQICDCTDRKKKLKYTQ